MSAPEWLAKRDGSLRPGTQSLVVLIGGSPQYKVEARPAAGTFVATVQQSNNGKRMGEAALGYPTADAALAGGLEQLRAALGW